MLEYKCLYMIFYDASWVRLLCLLWWSEAELFCVSAVFTNETEAELERDVYWVSFFRRAFIQFLPLLNRTTGIISIIWSWGVISSVLLTAAQNMKLILKIITVDFRI